MTQKGTELLVPNRDHELAFNSESFAYLNIVYVELMSFRILSSMTYHRNYMLEIAQNQGEMPAARNLALESLHGN